MTVRRDSGGEGGFLGRWSERKLQARSDPAPEALVEEAPAAELPVEAAPKTEAEIREELGLPDPEMLQKGDDFSAFMKAAVPAALRSRALRRLWLTDPVFANVDGLVEYGQDFTDAATVVPNLQTAYKAGLGLLRVRAEATNEPRAEIDTAREDPIGHTDQETSTAPNNGDQNTAEAGGDAGSDEKDADQVEPTEHAPEEGPAHSNSGAMAEPREEASPRPPRMRFQFES